jgi:uncharacterized protein (TIGR02646 family)
MKSVTTTRHIEHFRQRSRYHQGTFEWDNLFGSCNRPDNRGKHKDQCGNYDYQDLIKPDVEATKHLPFATAIKHLLSSYL